MLVEKEKEARMISYRSEPISVKVVKEVIKLPEVKGTNRYNQSLIFYLTDIAEQYFPCPSNQELASRLGYDCISSVSRALRGLNAAGIIKINSISKSSRTITVVATGKTTAVTKFKERLRK